MGRPEPFILTSEAFAPGGEIPTRHACDGEDLSPALRWGAPPPGTASLALEVSDPDAPRGRFVHWLGWGLDPALRQLPEGVAPPSEGRNGFGTVGYRGPCPPAGDSPHRYVFRLHALERELELEPGAGIEEFEAALPSVLIDTAELVGVYGRGAAT